MKDKKETAIVIGTVVGMFLVPVVVDFIKIRRRDKKLEAALKHDEEVAATVRELLDNVDRAVENAIFLDIVRRY